MHCFQISARVALGGTAVDCYEVLILEFEIQKTCSRHKARHLRNGRNYGYNGNCYSGDAHILKGMGRLTSLEPEI